jgi:photosystem II stability/assembly factor-like uncharacterized protein
MKFGIITPVYDKCLESTELLYEDLKRQTHQDWTWLICSNGYSQLFQDFVEAKNKSDKQKRLTYVSTNYVELQNNNFSIIANIGKRRSLCIQKIDCDYLFMFDADAKILDNKMFETINQELTRKPKKLCLYHIRHKDSTMPLFPLDDGKLDLLNFCVRADVAKKIGYPSTVDFFIPANDYKFFVNCYKACKGDAMILGNVFCEYNGNNHYKNARRLIVQMQSENYATTKKYVAYSVKHYPVGLVKAAKDLPFSRNILPYKAVFRRDVFFKRTPDETELSHNQVNSSLASESETSQVLQASWIAKDGTLYVTEFNTIYKSTDNGQTSQHLKSFNCKGIDSIYIDSENNIFASPGLEASISESGLWRSRDNGTTWTKVLDLPLSSSIWTIDEDANGKLFIGVYTRGKNKNAKIYRSTDGGASWTLVYFDSKARHIHAITVDKANNNVYATVGDKFVPESNIAYILRSEDSGNRWDKILKHLPQMVAVHAIPGARLFGTDDVGNGELYRSTDDKKTQKVLDTGAHSCGFWIRHDVASGRIFASFVSGEAPKKTTAIYQSHDKGLTWSIHRSFETNLPYEGSSRASNIHKGTLYYSTRLGGNQKNGTKIVIQI